MAWRNRTPVTSELLEDAQDTVPSALDYISRSVLDGFRRDRERIAGDWRRAGDHIGDVTGQKRKDQQP